MQNTKKAGIKDIATMAGVSIGTVDRVLHNRGHVNQDTRQKILDIVKQSGYTPNLFAKSLSSKKTTTIAIVIPDSSDNNPYWEKPVMGIKQASTELKNYNVEIVYEHFNASDPLSFSNILNHVITLNPDGVVINPVFVNQSVSFLQKLDSQNIPYVFIDNNIENTSTLGYFGQNALQSGRVAAKLVWLATSNIIDILIVKQTNNKIFSQHIESRINGFNNYFTDNNINVNTDIVEIDLLNTNEPDKTLSKIFEQNKTYHCIFVPNSRAYLLANYFVKNNLKFKLVIGYDLIAQNQKHLVNQNITYLLCQKPEQQAYKAINALFSYITLKTPVNRINFSAVDIVTNENLENYN